ncbi:MAG: hypothetical protein D6775_05535 [Caldilineae bacterium]|nr:MAG: hypothetical protein D6775_05535 [Caldilineae bacterium]
MKSRTTILFLLGVLLLATLACQTGEVLTPAEATARAKEARSVRLVNTPALGGGGQSSSQETEAEVKPGDTGVLVGRGYMISLYQEAGATRIIAQQERGVEVTVKDVTQVDGETWYLIDAPTGLGWIKAENLEVPKKAGAGGEGPQPGDTVYLVARSYMISLYQEAGANRIIAQQERGTAVTIVDVTEVDGEKWYLIDAPTGLGWVKGENITTEKP